MVTVTDTISERPRVLGVLSILGCALCRSFPVSALCSAKKLQMDPPLGPSFSLPQPRSNRCRSLWRSAASSVVEEIRNTEAGSSALGNVAGVALSRADTAAALAQERATAAEATSQSPQPEASRQASPEASRQQVENSRQTNRQPAASSSGAASGKKKRIGAGRKGLVAALTPRSMAKSMAKSMASAVTAVKHDVPQEANGTPLHSQKQHGNLARQDTLSNLKEVRLSERTVAEQAERAERKRKRGVANMATAVITTVLALLLEFLLDALSGGSCMILLPALFSLIFYAYGAAVRLVFGSTYYDGEGPAPPAPPVAPSLAETAAESLFDFAEAEPCTERRGAQTLNCAGA